MRGLIAIVDNLVDKSLQDELILLAQSSIWRYGWKSNVLADRFFFGMRILRAEW